jgi:hypothetical protein
LRLAGLSADLPDIGKGAHYVDLLLECGLCEYQQGFPIPLSFKEIAAWSQVSRIDLAGHEAQDIRQLSEWYCTCWARSRDPHMIDPMGSKKEAVADAFADLVTRFKQ